MASFRHVDHAQLLPDWMMKDPDISLAPDVMCEEAVFEAPAAVPPPPESEHFLPRCIAVGGLLHIFFNLSKELATCLPWWDEFWKRLKQLELLLGCRQRREAFISFVLAESELAHYQDDFNRGCPGHYDKRWNEVIEFCEKSAWQICVLG